MNNLFTQQGMIFVLIVAGVLIKRLNIVNDEGQKCMTNLVIDVILPCNIIKAFCIEFSKQKSNELVLVFAVAVLVQIISYIYGRIMFCNEDEGRKKCLRYGIICSNAGFLGNPIAEGLYGAYGLMLASVFLIPLRIMMWTEGIAIFSGSRDWKSTLKRTLTHPCIIACVIGLFMMITGFRFPAFVQNTITQLGACNTAMSMLIIGMILSEISPKTFIDKTVWIYCLHRLILLPLLVYMITKLLNAPMIVQSITVLLTAMPAGATTSILSAKYEVSKDFGAKLVIGSTLLSLVTLMVWSIILK